MIRSITKSEGSVTVFHLRENLEASRAKAFVKKIYELIESGKFNIVLEMSHVQQISLQGMVSISHLFNRCRQGGGCLKVVNLTDRVRASFQESNLINTIEVHASVVEAIKSYNTHNLLRSKKYSGSFYLEDTQAFVGWDWLPASGHFN